MLEDEELGESVNRLLLKLNKGHEKICSLIGWETSSNTKLFSLLVSEILIPISVDRAFRKLNSLVFDLEQFFIYF